jgi:hypothetical protein
VIETSFTLFVSTENSLFRRRGSGAKPAKVQLVCDHEAYVPASDLLATGWLQTAVANGSGLRAGYAALAWRAVAVQLRPPLVHVDRPAIYDAAVQSGDRQVSFSIQHFDESESPREARSPVGHELDMFDISMWLKERADRGHTGARIQVAHKDVLHVISLPFESGLYEAGWRYGQVGGTIKRTLSIAGFGAERSRIRSSLDR